MRINTAYNIMLLYVFTNLCYKKKKCFFCIMLKRNKNKLNANIETAQIFDTRFAYLSVEFFYIIVLRTLVQSKNSDE